MPNCLPVSIWLGIYISLKCEKTLGKVHLCGYFRSMKLNISDYLSFSAKERRASFVLIILIVSLSLASFFLKGSGRHIIDRKHDISVCRVLADSPFQGNVSYSQTYSNRELSGKGAFLHQMIRYRLHDFDPNVISVEEWRSMGVSEKTAIGIRKYVSKGGRFHHAADIRKIWGIDSIMASRLMPFIKINDSMTRFHSPVKRKAFVSLSTIEINTADTADFLKLTGIGPVRAARIIAFRNKLGGFVNISQFLEVYGIDDSLFNRIKSHIFTDGVPFRRIPINQSDVKELAAHPYIGFSAARAIVAYRRQHGNFSNADMLLNIIPLTQDAVRKISPYLLFQ